MNNMILLLGGLMIVMTCLGCTPDLTQPHPGHEVNQYPNGHQTPQSKPTTPRRK